MKVGCTPRKGGHGKDRGFNDAGKLASCGVPGAAPVSNWPYPHILTDPETGNYSEPKVSVHSVSLIPDTLLFVGAVPWTWYANG